MELFHRFTFTDLEIHINRCDPVVLESPIDICQLYKACDRRLSVGRKETKRKELTNSLSETDFFRVPPHFKRSDLTRLILFVSVDIMKDEIYPCIGFGQTFNNLQEFSFISHNLTTSYFISLLISFQDLPLTLKKLKLPLCAFPLKRSQFDLVEWITRFKRLESLCIYETWFERGRLYYYQRFLAPLTCLKTLQFESVHQLTYSYRLRFLKDLPLSLVHFHCQNFNIEKFSLRGRSRPLYDWWTHYLTTLPHLVCIRIPVVFKELVVRHNIFETYIKLARYQNHACCEHIKIINY
ncbi:MAG: hypothetical protein Sylvanvirus6_1 [Sylvanvirus sp.]|uniref:Uncharacterized protein n=1 Tax=Sylvanvirus sp. TaxID=2487774 RepID=A0A3G5AHL7_9VIRU|nr:MAG: hypothetical protein Sylvanvirus6_1 [Sylvanvirus sp.]